MAYKALVKAACRSDWETGNFTFEQISQNRQVPANVIRHWSSRGNWEKGKLIPQLSAAVQEKHIEALARLGMKKDDALKILIEGMKDPMMTQFEGKGEQMIATPVKDYKLILGYLKEYLSITDAYPAQRIEIDIRQVQAKIISVLVEVRDCLPEDKRDYFKQRIEEALG